MNTNGILRLLSELLSAVVLVARAGGSIAEIRKRLADGIQRGDLVSNDALAVVAEAAADVEDYIENG